MRNIVWVFVVLAAVLALVVAGYSVIVIGIDLFREPDAMSGMGFAVGAMGLLLARGIGLAPAMGVRYLRTIPTEHVGGAGVPAVLPSPLSSPPTHGDQNESENCPPSPYTCS